MRFFKVLSNEWISFSIKKTKNFDDLFRDIHKMPKNTHVEVGALHLNRGQIVKFSNTKYVYIIGKSSN